MMHGFGVTRWEMKWSDIARLSGILSKCLKMSNWNENIWT
jgi:hypothetical protein